MNAASPGCNQRPRYLIDLADLADFERRRTVGPSPEPVRRQRKAVAGREWY